MSQLRSRGPMRGHSEFAFRGVGRKFYQTRSGFLSNGIIIERVTPDKPQRSVPIGPGEPESGS